MCSTQPLATAWDLPAKFPYQYSGSNPSDPVPFNTSSNQDLTTWVNTTYACNRAGAHFIATLIKQVPRSEARLRDQGLIPFYDGTCDLSDALTTMASQHNITLAPCERLHRDYLQQCEIDERTSTTVRSFVAPQMQGMLDLLDKITTGVYQYHWTSLVAFMGVSSEAFINQAAARKTVTALDNHSHAPFIQAIASEKMLAASKVIMEDLARLREQSSSSGWREQEAQELAVEHLKMIPKHESVGIAA